MPQFIDSIEYTDTEGSKVALDGITSVSTVDASTLSVASAINIIPNENGAVNPLGRKADSVVGGYSTALGDESTASGIDSTAIGSIATASGGGSVALGRESTASSRESTAIGYYTNALGEYSTALGRGSKAEGEYSIALGGDSTASGAQSTALGYAANASGENSTAVGDTAVAQGTSSIALGNNSTTEDEGSIALGCNATTEASRFGTSRYSMAIGYGAKATEDYSIALGYNAEVPINSSSSIALGHESRAVGEGTIAIGYGASGGVSSVALGSNSSAPSAASVALGAGASVPSTDSSTVQLGSASLSALRCKVNLTVTSDKRDKTDIEDITNALAFVERLNPVTFVSNDREYYISDEDKKGETFRTYGMCEYDRVSHAAGTKKGERRRCGLLAQEVVEAMQSVYGTDNYANVVNDNFHDLTNKPSDVENKYTLAYANLVPFLIGAIKELNAKIKILEGKLATSSVAGTQED